MIAQGAAWARIPTIMRTNVGQDHVSGASKLKSPSLVQIPNIANLTPTKEP
jgi:hypothetical protein